MKWCKNCVLPDTRPNIVIEQNGVCNACMQHKKKSSINWKEREQQFARVVESAKTASKGYDCLIPVSGGKDSHWQVIKCREYGLNPLAVTWKTPVRTKIGRENLENLVRLGVDHIDYQVNPNVEKIFLLESLIQYGATAIPMHMAMFNIPLRIAAGFDIPLIVWGENSAAEYGSPDEAYKGFRLDRRWLKRYGVTHGTTAKDWISEKLTEKALTPYYSPADGEMDKKGISAVFLGYYFHWDPQETFDIASANGFSGSEAGPKTGYYDFADIDDEFISIHHFLKWYKFGITRTFDNLSIEIRNGRITRETAIEVIVKQGDITPHRDIRRFCQFTGITEKRFFEIIEHFRNLDIWSKQNDTWMIKNFLIEDWNWT